MRRVRLSREASADLDEIWLYVAERDGIERAQRLVERIAALFPLIAAHPRLGRSREDLGEGLRSISEGNYRVYYRHGDGRIDVARILHSKREEKRQFRV
jgi:toxin ParE1/3/4